MSEHQQEDKHKVDMGEFISSMKFAVSADELNQVAKDRDIRRRFILRLLDPTGSEAFDRFVELAAADDIASADSRESLLVSVRPVSPDGETGRIEPPYKVDNNGIIPDNPGSDLDRGYFVDVPGMDADEFYHAHDMVERKQPAEAPPLKYLVAEPPSDEEQRRYYG